jgi:hypothetical protein
VISSFLPEWQFRERHETTIRASCGSVMDAIAGLSTASDPIVTVLIALREFPARVLAWLGIARGRTGQPRFGMADFTCLGRQDKEIVYGLAGKFWRLDYGFAPIADGTAFKAFAQPGSAKLAMGFLVTESGSGVRLTTETRVFCLDEEALRSFRPYWFLIRVASGLIRRRMLRVIKYRAELNAAPIQGDAH